MFEYDLGHDLEGHLKIDPIFLNGTLYFKPGIRKRGKFYSRI